MSTVFALYNYWIAVFLMMTGFFIVIARGNLVKKIIGLNIFQTAVFLLYITLGKVSGATAPILDQEFESYSNPLPSVLILTAIVVGVATTSLALALIVRIHETYGTVEEDEIQTLDPGILMGSQLPILQIVVPLVAAPFCVLLRRSRLALGFTLGVSWATFALAVALFVRVTQTGTLSYALGGWAAPWGIEYRIDALGAFMLLFVSGIGAIVFSYAPPSLAREIPRDRHYLFCAAYLLCLTGLLGIIITGDLFNLFVFLEISSLSSYALISLGSDRRALTAAFQYLILGTIGATFILIGIGLLYSTTGTLNMADMAERLGAAVGLRTVLVAFAFFSVGVCLKMALFPLHLWLPDAYTFAPSVVSALLAATATKVSVYILLRFVFTVYGEQFAFETMPLDGILMPLALVGIFVASTVAIFQRNIKRMLAYSSIAQVGYMVLGISFASVTGLTGGIVHLFNHALMKGGLFLAMGCYLERLGSVEIDDLRGVGRSMPWTTLAWAFGGLGLIGVPLTAGFVSKWYLIGAAWERGWWPVAVAVLGSSLLAVVYVWRVIETAYFGTAPAGREPREASVALLIPTWTLIGASLVFGVWTSLPTQAARRAAEILLGGSVMAAESAMLLALGLTLASAALTYLFGGRPNVREFATLAAGGLVLFSVISLAPEVLAGQRPRVELLELLPGLALAFEVEPLGLLFALLASGLWIVTTVYSIGYLRGHGERNQTRFFAFFAVAIFGALGVALAANLLTLFVFYEVLTLSTYPLVTHHGDDKARRGGRVYLGILLGTSIGLLLLAVLWTWFLAGTLEFTPGGILAGKADAVTLGLLLALFAFGTGKAALMPLHRWLPAAMVAPTPVSALLHAVAVVKAGVFTVMKIAVYVFGLDLLRDTGISVWLMYVAGATVILASLIALRKDNLKARLAYSTVSQLSYIVLGAALATPRGVLGGSMHIAMHAFGKITLFFCAGAIYVASHKTEISDMRGIGRAMPVTMFAFLIGALSVIGLPPFGGSWSKWYLALGAADAGQLLFVAVLMISSLLNVAYLIPPVARGFFLAPTGGTPDGIREAPLFCVLPLCLTAAGCVVLFFYAGRVRELLLPLTGF